MGAPADQTTRRDAETWLAWALFGADLEMIEAEHEAAVARRERRAQLGDDANLSPETSAPPSPMPPAQARFGDTSPSPSPSSAGHDQRDMSKINVHPGAEDWDPDDPVKGDRLLFVHYCRELIEARQGFAYPTRSSAWAPDAHPDPRRAPTNKMMRLTIDPVRVRSRPLASYLLTNALSRLTIRHATWKGFSREREGKLEYLILRPREWTREKAEKDEKYMPIVFLHGLGIGERPFCLSCRVCDSPVAYPFSSSRRSSAIRLARLLLPNLPPLSNASNPNPSPTRHLARHFLSAIPPTARPSRDDESDASSVDQGGLGTEWDYGPES